MHTFDDVLLPRLVASLAIVPGVVAVVLGGSRARGTANQGSDYDIGLFIGPDRTLDTERLLGVVRTLVDDSDSASVTPVGGWGPRIVGGGWLSVTGRKVMLPPWRRLLTSAARAEFRWIISRGILTDSALRPGWARSFCASRFMIRAASSPH